MSASAAAHIREVEIIQQSSMIRCLAPGCDRPAGYRFVFDDQLSTWLCPGCTLDVDDPTLDPGSGSAKRQTR